MTTRLVSAAITFTFPQARTPPSVSSHRLSRSGSSKNSRKSERGLSLILRPRDFRVAAHHKLWDCRGQRPRLQLRRPMLSIQKIFGRDEKFYDLLETSAQEADASVHHLIALLERLEQHESPQSLEEFILSRRKDKEITQELTEQLCKVFITPFEREDIQALAGALYKIP